MESLSEMLKDLDASGVYLPEPDFSVETLAKIAGDNGPAFFHIEGREIRDKTQFLKQTAKELNFPDYFGYNWDAFSDCLTDMSWIEGDGFVVLFTHLDSFMEHSRPEFDAAVDIFEESVEFWVNRGKRMFILLQLEKPSERDFLRVKI